jgi:hypothetical protein
VGRPRIRSVKPEVWQNEEVGSVSRDARLLFVGLITMADDEGRFRALPPLILGHTFPFDKDAPRNLGKWLGELCDAADPDGVPLLVLYEIGGRPYGWLPGFTDNQRISKPKPSKFPPPPSDLEAAA